VGCSEVILRELRRNFSAMTAEEALKGRSKAWVDPNTIMSPVRATLARCFTIVGKMMAKKADKSVAIDCIELENLLQELVVYQKKKLLQCGQQVVPQLTEDDLLQPNDFLQLENHPLFRYEEGVLAGILTVQMAIQAAIPSKTSL